MALLGAAAARARHKAAKTFKQTTAASLFMVCSIDVHHQCGACPICCVLSLRNNLAVLRGIVVTLFIAKAQDAVRFHM
jgi:hypothetical protein